MARFVVLSLLALSLLAAPALADSNILRLSGGVVAVEQIVPASGPARWYATIRTPVGDVRVEAATTSAKNVLSTLTTGNVPQVLYTGGCFPIQEAVSGGTEELVHAWVCGGTGTGICKIADGWADDSPYNAHMIDGKAGAISACF